MFCWISNFVISNSRIFFYFRLVVYLGICLILWAIFNRQAQQQRLSPHPIMLPINQSVHQVVLSQVHQVPCLTPCRTIHLTHTLHLHKVVLLAIINQNWALGVDKVEEGQAQVA